MDRSIYVAMTGATQTMRAQESVSHNLANASTVGFKSEMSSFQSLPVLGQGLATRINAVAQGQGQDFAPGSSIQTGRSLDVAVRGSGWIAVQAPDGSQGYTRAGDLQLTADGQLTDAAGHPVIGGGGPISLPPSTKLSIGADGTISAIATGEGPAAITVLDRLKLVNPDTTELVQGDDGLMHMADGTQAQADPDVRVSSGELEGSNVNPSTELVKMIALSRQYDMQVKAIKSADDNASAATRLLQSS